MTHTGANGTALVIGGGGTAGIAWEIGLFAGLAEAGVDVTGADLMIGTSAGSVVAAQLSSGVPMAELLARQVDPAKQVAEVAPATPLSWLFERVIEINAVATGPEDKGRRAGALALGRAPELLGVTPARRREIVAGRLPSHDWPANRLGVVALNAHTGAPRLFDCESGVSMVDAIMASCALPGIWPMPEIEGQYYLDGGLRSNENADFAAGYRHVLVVTPRTLDLPTSGWRLDLSTQTEGLRAAGSQVEVVQADEDSLTAFGDDPLDPASRAPSGLAGYRQGKAVAAEVADAFPVTR